MNKAIVMLAISGSVFLAGCSSVGDTISSLAPPAAGSNIHSDGQDQVASLRGKKSVKFGINYARVENMANAVGCDNVQTLNLSSPIEVYKASCPNGETMVYKCEWTTCQGI